MSIIIDYIISISIWSLLIYNGYSRIIILILFLIELLIIISNLIDIYFCKNYVCIKITDINETNIWNKNIIKIWFYYVEWNSFDKTYKFLSKFKINFISLLLLIIIFILGIPIRTLKLIYYNVLSLNYRKNIIDMCIDLNYKNIDKKIEVINGSIELNCGTSGKLISELIKSTPKERREWRLIFETIAKLREIRKNNSTNKDTVELKSSVFYKKGKIIQDNHFTYHDKETNTLLHFTSNAAKKEKFYVNNQRIDDHLESMVKNNAKAPASILTESKSYDKIDWLYNSKNVNKNELNYLKSINNDLLYINDNDLKTTNEIFIEMQSIIYGNLRINEFDSKKIIKKINYGHFDETFKMDLDLLSLEVKRNIEDDDDKFDL